MSLCCYLEYILIVVGVIFAFIAVADKLISKKRDLKGKHVMITGGSSGIGLSVAHEVAGRGAHVTLIARNIANLEKAKADVEATVANSVAGGKVQIFSVNLGCDSDAVSSVIKDAEAVLGPVYMLVNCAGFSRAQKFEELSPQVVKSVMDVNVLGSFFITQEAVRSMKQQQEGIIVFTSSQGGLLGLYGFSAYSAAKGALIKLAEALHMEVKPYNITVTVCCPPDTDTPGFEEENKTKPTETKLISEAAGLFKPEEVAHKLVEDALAGKFMTTNGLEGFMLTALCAGMGPITDLKSFLAQVLLSGVFRAVSAFYLWSFDRIVYKEYQQRMSSKKAE
ncbi:hypothetical protein SK128_020402 [Halocaridina rubra]|uniref:3-dehydrosphinganine reductase n=1 Tax=Halocaridina rubra TaxID=373956 RepID=A0AAN8WFX9_HALRR